MDRHESVRLSAFLLGIVYNHASVCVCVCGKYTDVVSCDVQSLNVRVHSAVSKVCRNAACFSPFP